MSKNKHGARWRVEGAPKLLQYMQEPSVSTKIHISSSDFQDFGSARGKVKESPKALKLIVWECFYKILCQSVL